MRSVRQKLLKWVYPLLISLKGNDDKQGKKLYNNEDKQPLKSFYDLKALSNSGKEVSMGDYKGKKILLVNVASNCGFTQQYEALEKLYQEHEKELIVLGFPSNDFKEQETGTDKEIEQFCKINFGVTFPLFKKQSVLKPSQGEVYQWLSDENQNGWNKQEPVWNFSKYIIDEKGKLKNFFGPAVSPLSPEVKDSLGIKK